MNIECDVPPLAMLSSNRVAAIHCGIRSIVEQTIGDCETSGDPASVTDDDKTSIQLPNGIRIPLLGIGRICYRNNSSESILMTERALLFVCRNDPFGRLQSRHSGLCVEGLPLSNDRHSQEIWRWESYWLGHSRLGRRTRSTLYHFKAVASRFRLLFHIDSIESFLYRSRYRLSRYSHIAFLFLSLARVPY